MAIVPTEMTAVAGAILTATQWNTNVRDAINFLLTPPLAICRQNATQSIANFTWVAITFDLEDIDRDNMHSITTNTSRLTAQTAGYYEINAIFALASNATGPRATRLQVNASTVVARSTVGQATNGLQHGQEIVGMVYLNVGDYVELQGLQSSGGAVSTTNLSDTANLFTARWVSTA